MPTDAHQQILDRDHMVVITHEIRRLVSPLLQELVNQSTNAVVRCSVSSTHGVNVDIPPIMLYLHIIELTDAIEVLFSRSCVQPSVLLLRSVFEALLQLEYMLSDDFPRRSLSWLVCDVHQRVQQYELLDSTTQRGREFEVSMGNDEVFRSLDFTQYAGESRRSIERITGFLQREEIVPIENEYERMCTLLRRPPAPYALFDGPRDIRSLAQALSRPAQYDSLYRFWSRAVHGGDWRRFAAGRDDAGRVEIWPLRNPAEIRNFALIASHFVMEATRLVVNKYRPGEDLRLWFEREIMPLRDQLLRLEVRIVAGQDS